VASARETLLVVATSTSSLPSLSGRERVRARFVAMPEGTLVALVARLPIVGSCQLDWELSMACLIIMKQTDGPTLSKLSSFYRSTRQKSNYEKR
jgi:hypothetical protein